MNSTIELLSTSNTACGIFAAVDHFIDSPVEQEMTIAPVDWNFLRYRIQFSKLPIDSHAYCN